MSFKFKPEDFLYPEEDKSQHWSVVLAKLANQKLQAYLATLPKVYGNFGVNNHNEIVHKDRNPAHTALLWGITEIEKECSHLIVEYCGGKEGLAQCHYCGVKLKAIWSKI